MFSKIGTNVVMSRMIFHVPTAMGFQDNILVLSYHYTTEEDLPFKEHSYTKEFIGAFLYKGIYINHKE